jgi:hypothetical protein
MEVRCTILGLLCAQILIAQVTQLNDEFNSPCNLADWSNITEVEGWMTPGGIPAEHLEEFDISSTYPGELYMKPWTTSWYNNLRGALIFKEITGDFVFTTEIIVRNGEGQDQLPSTTYSLAGMMIRTPKAMTGGISEWQPGQENYVFLSIGRASSGNNGPYQLEVKSTTNSNSNLNISNIGVSQIYMRMVKANGAILVLRSFDNVTWTVHARYARPDFPETVQIGYVTYTDWPRVNAHWNNNIENVRNHNTNILNDDYINAFGWNPDLIGRFGFSRFDDVNLPVQYETVNLAEADPNSNGINDADLLSFFGYPTIPSHPSADKIWNGSQDSDWTNPSNWNGGLPQAGDHVLIPNCNCDEVEMPILPENTPTFSSFRLEAGGHLVIPANRTLNIDLQTPGMLFLNEGTIENHGTIHIVNSIGREVRSVSILNNNPGAEFRIE